MDVPKPPALPYDFGGAKCSVFGLLADGSVSPAWYFEAGAGGCDWPFCGLCFLCAI
jgi:hypothetical protein